MFLYVYNGRHIVASAVEKPEDGTLKVVRVGLVSDIGGAKRRGRHPDFTQPVPVAKLVLLEDASDELKTKAESLLTGNAVAEVSTEAAASEDEDEVTGAK
jgi:hypothetical protein